jgi:transposase
VVLADKAYSSRAIRTHLRRRGIRTVIPQPSDQIANRKKRGRSGGRPPAFDREAYKQRNTVERCINKLKQWRGLATRYDLPRRTPHPSQPRHQPVRTAHLGPPVVRIWVDGWDGVVDRQAGEVRPARRWCVRC